MKKVYIVMDEPESCTECRLLRNGNFGTVSCTLREEFLGFKKEDIKYMKRPRWCPLKPLPEKPDYPPIGAESFVAGWNACIDRIFGGGESDERG